LEETKNGAVIRKHPGYAHIPQCCAAVVNTFCTEHLNPYLNTALSKAMVRESGDEQDRR
jgi:hypothetical protein